MQPTEASSAVRIYIAGIPGPYATDRGTRWQLDVRAAVRAVGVEPFPAEVRLGVDVLIRDPITRPSDQADLDNIVKHTIDALDGVLGVRQQLGSPQADDGRIDVITARRQWTEPGAAGAVVTVWRLDAGTGVGDVITLAGRRRIDLDTAASIVDSYPLTTLRLYDGLGASDDPRFTPTDIGRLIVIEPLNQRVAVRLLEATVDWSLLTPGAALVTADPDGPVYAAAAQLYGEVADITGVGPAIASKVLHLKRPHFFPLLDSVVRDLYHDAAAHAYAASQVWQAQRPDWRHLHWAAIRSDLLDTGNREGLRELRDRLLAPPTSEQRQRAAALSDVRLLDILAWGATRSPATARTNDAAGATPNS